MKIVVVGANGLIGSRVMPMLRTRGHHVIAVGAAAAADSITVDGLTESFHGAQVVVDVSEPASFDDGAGWDFVTAVTTNLLTAAEAADVTHYVALSDVAVGAAGRGYLRAKSLQELLIGEAAIDYSIVRATPCYDFIGCIADLATHGDTVRIPSALVQPMAADDVATALVATASGRPTGGITEVAGPYCYPLDLLVRIYLRAHRDSRRVRAEPEATFFGGKLNRASLLPAAGATVFNTSFTDWFRQRTAPAVGWRGCLNSEREKEFNHDADSSTGRIR